MLLRMEFCILSNCNICTWTDTSSLSCWCLCLYPSTWFTSVWQFLSYTRNCSNFTETGVHCSVHNLQPLSWARSIQSMLSHQIALSCVLILYFHQILNLPSGFLRFPPQTPVSVSLLSHTCHLLHAFGEQYQSWNTSYAVFFSLPSVPPSET